MKRKVELIHQIRAMEAAPISRNKLVDFTETAGYRFLNEMCIAEVPTAHISIADLIFHADQLNFSTWNYSSRRGCPY